MAQEDRLAKLPKSKMADRGSKAHHPVLEEELMVFVSDRRRRGVGVKTVWGKRPGELTKRSMLVLDSFSCHKTSDVKELLGDYKTRLAIIPGGMTLVLQPLDVSVSKPMKVMLQDRWNDWYGADEHSFTKTGRMRKVELQDICQWIVNAWTELDPQIIVKAFKKYCILNRSDGTEDNVVWEHLVQPRGSTGDADD